ncbi:MAG: type II toxin-antitoxin system tRNA(fMet)-specific endonuclease VapC [Panacagrimonas sp.]
MAARYLLDTNILIAAIGGESAKLLNRIATLAPERLCLSSIVLAELLTGAEKSQLPAHNKARLTVLVEGMETLPFDADDAASYGRIRAALERAGQTIGPLDMLIAAQALTRKLVLVTANLKEFQRVPGLKCENWLK